MTLPNFLIIGAAKAGTTSLYTYLQQHPQVFLSTPKEPRFFAFEGTQPNFQGPVQIINQTSITDLPTYKALFAETQDAIAIGEASTVYLYEPSAIDRIRQYVPDTKLIAILRNPVKRAFSSYLHLVRDGQEPLSFEEALIQEPLRIKQNWPPLWHYRARGYYYHQLKPYFEAFDRDRIKIILFEDLQTDPEAMVHDLYQFLNVDPTYKANVSQRLNVSGVPKQKWISQIIDQNNPLKSLAKALIPEGFRKSLYQKIKQSNLGHKPKIEPRTQQMLIADYRKDILLLQDLIQRDLSHWL